MILNKIVEIIKKNKSSIKIEDDVLLCDYLIEDFNFLQSLYDKKIIENFDITDFKENENITLEFSITRLIPQRFYLTKESFLQWNYYNAPASNVYIYEINDFLDNDLFNEGYSVIVELLKGLEKNSKLSYNEEEIINLLIVQEDKSLLLYLEYFIKDLETIDDIKLKLLKSFIEVLNENIIPDRKNIYINELIDFLVLIDKKDRFSYLIQNFEEFIHRASSSYNFYLRNFSYNKLKIELETKSLEFYQKIQGVINDSQTKLIAIPATLGLSLTVLDFNETFSLKIFLILISVIIFCIFIQIFINNQKSVLQFISENIESYKKTHSKNEQELQKSFEKVDKESKKQRKRLKFMQFLLWLNPILIIGIVLFMHLNIFIYLFISKIIPMLLRVFYYILNYNLPN